MLLSENIKEIKVSSKTDPKQLASSIALFIQDGYSVKATAIGEALKNILKAIALMNTFEHSLDVYDFQPQMGYIETPTGIMPAVVIYIAKKQLN